jgi:hypothetical protein
LQQLVELAKRSTLPPPPLFEQTCEWLQMSEAAVEHRPRGREPRPGPCIDLGLLHPAPQRVTVDAQLLRHPAACTGDRQLQVRISKKILDQTNRPITKLDRGEAPALSRSPPWSGSTGSTTDASSRPSGTSHRSKPRPTTTAQPSSLRPFRWQNPASTEPGRFSRCGRGVVRPGTAGERGPAPVDPTAVADHDGEGGAVPPRVAHRVRHRPGVQDPRRGAGRPG